METLQTTKQQLAVYDSPTEDTYQEMKKMTKSIQSMDKSIQKLQKRMDAFDSNRGEVSNE